MSRALIITCTTGLQYAEDGTSTKNIYVKRETFKLKGVVYAVLDMSASLSKICGSKFHLQRTVTLLNRALLLSSCS